MPFFAITFDAPKFDILNISLKLLPSINFLKKIEPNVSPAPDKSKKLTLLLEE